VDALSESLSIVLPAWNEETVIAGLVSELDREVASRFEQAEIVVVDDASTDATADRLAELSERLTRLRVLRSPRNEGHGPSVLRALRAASGEWIFQLDSDGQFVVSDFWDLWRAREQADMILGMRVDRQDPSHRLALSRAVSAVVSLLAGRRLRDPNVPFRLFRRGVWEDLRGLVGERALAPSILLATGAAVHGWRVAEVPVTHLARAQGTSSLRAGRLVRFSARGLAELLRFRVELARAPRRSAP